MKCVHGIRIDKPCPDCEYEADCRARGVQPENRPPKRISFSDEITITGTEINAIDSGKASP